MLAKLDSRSWVHASGPYRGLGFTFMVRSMDNQIGLYLERALAPLRARCPVNHVYSIVDRGGGYRYRYAVYVDGCYIMRTGVGSGACAYVLWHVNRGVVRESRDLLLLHASAATWDGWAAVFPAGMESGKTTLVAGLLQRGWGYLTDEALGIDPQTLLAHPYGKALSIDDGSWDTLRELEPRVEPELAALAARQWQVDPRSIGAGVISGPAPVRLIISPRYEAGSPTKLEPISRARAVLMMAENSFDFAHHGAGGLEALARVACMSHCYLLTNGSLAEACDTIMEAAQQLAPRR